MFSIYNVMIIIDNYRLYVTSAGRHVTFTGVSVTFTGQLCDVYRNIMWRLQGEVTSTGSGMNYYFKKIY